MNLSCALMTLDIPQMLRSACSLSVRRGSPDPRSLPFFFTAFCMSRALPREGDGLQSPAAYPVAFGFMGRTSETPSSAGEAP